jgi:hypothetical protein
MSDTRQHAHEIIDHIPESQLSTAVGLLEKILDPVTLALLNAPIDDEPVTEQEKLAIAEADEWFKRNGDKGIPHEEAMRRLGLD